MFQEPSSNKQGTNDDYQNSRNEQHTCNKRRSCCKKQQPTSNQFSYFSPKTSKLQTAGLLRSTATAQQAMSLLWPLTFNSLLILAHKWIQTKNPFHFEKGFFVIV